MKIEEIVKDALGFRLLGLHTRAKILDISVYKARKLVDEYIESGLIKKWGNSFYLTKKGLIEYATLKGKFQESNTG